PPPRQASLDLLLRLLLGLGRQDVRRGRTLSERARRRLSERPDVLPGHAVRRSDDDDGRRSVRGGRAERCAGAEGERTGGLNELLRIRLELGREQLRQVRSMRLRLLFCSHGSPPMRAPASPLAHEPTTMCHCFPTDALTGPCRSLTAWPSESVPPGRTASRALPVGPS
ncbi:hypothetical protein ACHAWF_002714, partial [Thalassiosira exigua]